MDILQAYRMVETTSRKFKTNFKKLFSFKKIFLGVPNKSLLKLKLKIY